MKGEQEVYRNVFYNANVYQEPGKLNRNVPLAKYTCRFDIQIENDREFQVTRKIMGAKGCNVRRIVDLCARGNAGASMEVVRVRLRGRGSDCPENPVDRPQTEEPRRAENDDPLNLSITSRYYDKYLLARHLAKELILNVYEDYKRYCDRTGKEPIVGLQIKMTESISGIKAPQSVPPLARAESAPVPRDATATLTPRATDPPKQVASAREEVNAPAPMQS